MRQIDTSIRCSFIIFNQTQAILFLAYIIKAEIWHLNKIKLIVVFKHLQAWQEFSAVIIYNTLLDAALLFEEKALLSYGELQGLRDWGWVGPSNIHLGWLDHVSFTSQFSSQ